VIEVDVGEDDMLRLDTEGVEPGPEGLEYGGRTGLDQGRLNGPDEVGAG
jgi:hypothetical protein